MITLQDLAKDSVGIAICILILFCNTRNFSIVLFESIFKNEVNVKIVDSFTQFETRHLPSRLFSLFLLLLQLLQLSKICFG